MARFSFMCVYLLQPIFAICQFLRKEMFLYIGIARHQYFKGNTVRKEFSYMKPFQNFLKEMKNILEVFFPLLSTSSFPYLLEVLNIYFEIYLLINICWVISLVKCSRPTGHSESCEIPSERAACGHHLGLWQFSYQLQGLSAAFQSTAPVLCKAALSYYKLKGKGLQRNVLPEQEWVNKMSNLGG